MIQGTNGTPRAYVDKQFRMYHPSCYHAMKPKPELLKILYNVKQSTCTLCGERIYNR